MVRHAHQLRGGRRPGLLICLLSGLGAFAGTAMAVGPVVEGDLRADSLCIDAEADGGNCLTSASDGQVRLEAETVRMRFLDSTAGNTTTDGLGSSWSLLANDYIGAQDPRTYFGFTLRSVDPTPDDGANNIAAEHTLRLGPATSASGSGNAVAIGPDSELVEGVVTLGSESVQSRLVHVAAAMQETDALIKRQLEAGLLGSVGDIADRLTELEDEVTALELMVDDDDDVGGDGNSDSGGGSSGGGSSGGGGLMGVPALLFLAALLTITRRQRTIAA